ncbi:SDR family NAD(P)-dependent oxidoreductase [Pseudomonas citronellolis]|uniref:SDR family NAD(P)-dependent oxidoreductase n=1 Tax=Pseudomonas citronellolis TaxID=53408 RepID=UPI00078ECDE8|nr:SDR family NAD(P)-dependent oxidoreductase [Pseudomonas citronellolis]AMO76100.1 D-beta-hydroxybutyrate dehydrogenase [Pseudomonas citronellolis]
MRPLTGKRALITGSAAGLGLAIGEALANAGCNVILHGRAPAEDMASLCTELSERHNSSIGYQPADLSTEAGVQGLVDDAANRLGGIDILINNAVTRHFAPIHEFPVEAWERALAVNLSAVFHATRRVLPAMREQRWGRIINLTSIYGMRGTPNRVDYVTTKSALLGFSRVVALENLDFGITCNSVSPGSTWTPSIAARVEALRQSENLSEEEAVRRFLSGKQPSGRFNDARHVGDLIVFLSGDAGTDITGAMLPVDGGWLAS